MLFLKQYLLFFSFLFLSFEVFSLQSNIDVIENKAIEKIFNIDSTQVRFKSLVSNNYLNGTKKIIYLDKSYSILSLINGLPSGKWILNNKDHKIERVMDYVDGKKHGKEIYFYPSGNKKLVANFLNGLQEGITEMYYPNGAKGGEFYCVKGKKQGVEKWIDEIYGKVIYKAYYIENQKVDSTEYYSRRYR